MCPSLIEIGSKTAEKNSAQTNSQTNRHYENNGHMAVNQKPLLNGRRNKIHREEPFRGCERSELMVCVRKLHSLTCIIIYHFSGPDRATGALCLSVCLSVCLCVQTVAFELNDLWPRYLTAC